MNFTAFDLKDFLHKCINLIPLTLLSASTLQRIYISLIISNFKKILIPCDPANKY